MTQSKATKAKDRKDAPSERNPSTSAEKAATAPRRDEQRRPLVRSKHTAGIPMNDPNSVF
jgi:hypothetical protein